MSGRRPRGPQITPITERDQGNFLRQSIQAVKDTTREFWERRFFSRVGDQDKYLAQMDPNGLALYCLRGGATSSVADPAVKWRKIAEIDCSGNVKFAGTVTQSVSFTGEDL